MLTFFQQNILEQNLVKIIEKYSFYVFRKKFELSAFVVTATPRKALVVPHVKVLPIVESCNTMSVRPVKTLVRLGICPV